MYLNTNIDALVESNSRRGVKISKKELWKKIKKDIDDYIDSANPVEKELYQDEMNDSSIDLTARYENILGSLLQSDYSYKFRDELEDKVYFSSENVEVNHASSYWTDAELGLQTLDNGFSYFGVLASGDWEEPIYYILYYDTEKINAYLPLSGNIYNADSMQALGNSDDLDNIEGFEDGEINGDIMFIAKQKNLPLKTVNQIIAGEGKDRLDYHWKLIRQDIKRTIRLYE